MEAFVASKFSAGRDGLVALFKIEESTSPSPIGRGRGRGITDRRASPAFPLPNPLPMGEGTEACELPKMGGAHL